MHGLRTIAEINASACKTFDQERAEHAANLAAAEKINELRGKSLSDGAIQEVEHRRASQRKKRRR